MSAGHIDINNRLTVFYSKEGEPRWNGEFGVTWRSAIRSCRDKIEALRARASEIEAWVNVAEKEGE